MAVQLPTPEQVRAAAGEVGLSLTDADVESYIGLMKASVEAYNLVDRMPDCLPEVKYPRTPGRFPGAEENTHNAWYVKTSIAGADAGPLKGKKVAIKDNAMVAGVPMMNGNSILEGYVPEMDATVVTRLLDAGAEIVGKTHCESYCLSGSSHTGAKGPVHNPYKMGYSAGGSSSGSGVVVALGEADMALGGDQGGSIRIPACWCGVYGMKPTHGLVPYTGVMPIEVFLDHTGPMTASVADNALMLEVIAGVDGYDPRQYSPKVAPYREALGAGARGMKIALVKEGFRRPESEKAVDEKVRQGAEIFKGLGVIVEEVSIPMHLAGAAIWTPIGVEGIAETMMFGDGYGLSRQDLYVTSLIDKLHGWTLRANELSETAKLWTTFGVYVHKYHGALRKSLVIAQVTLSLLLLIGAGLFTKSLGNLRNLGPGFSPQNLVGFDIDPSYSGYNVARMKVFYPQLLGALSSIPGVQSSGLASMRILEDDEWDSGMTVEGFTPPTPDAHPEPFMNEISPNYFATLGVPIVNGRDFRPSDTREVNHHPEEPFGWNPAVVMINETFAKKYFAGRNPIGLHVGFGSDPGTPTDVEVIGVVKDIKYTNLRDEIPAQAYLPYIADRYIGGMVIYVRTIADPTLLMSSIRAKVRDLDSNIPISSMHTTEVQINNSLSSERMIASLSAVFGFLATLLAVIGLYGVMAYTVAQRTREVGIRMALGAAQGNVIWLVMREVLILVAVGVVAGVPASLALTKLVQSQLFGLTPHDPRTLTLATIALAFVACAAGYVPAWRASRLDPMKALRYE